MKRFLKKNWFVISILGMVLLGTLFGPALSSPMEHFPLRLMIVLVMFFTAVSLPSGALGSALRRPKAVIWSVLLGYTLVPLLAIGLGKSLFHGHPDLAIGLIIAGSVPCTLASAVIWTRLAGGQEAVALLVTLSSNLLCFIVTSTWIAWGTGTTVQLDLASMVQSMFIVIAIPVGLGQLSRMIPRVAAKATEWKIPIGILNRCLILMVVLSAAVKAGTRCRTTPISPMLLIELMAACLAIHITAWLIGWYSSRKGFHFPRKTAIAVSFSCSQKTLPVGLYVASQFFPHLGLASLPMLVYHVSQLVCDTWIASRLAATADRSDPSDDQCEVVA